MTGLKRLHLKPWIPLHYLCYKHLLCCSIDWALKATGLSWSWKTGFEVAKQQPNTEELPRGAHKHQGELKLMREVLGLGCRDMWWIPSLVLLSLLFQKTFTTQAVTSMIMPTLPT